MSASTPGPDPVVESLGRRERNKRRTRARVQDAALDLFDRQGFGDTTIGQVADAADVAVRTVTIHFPTKEDLLLGDDAFDVGALRSALLDRTRDEDALDAFRRWLDVTLRELGADLDRGAAADHVWRRRAIRNRLILSDERLRGRVRGSYYALEQALAEAVAVDLGTTPDALACRLTAVTVVAGTRELYESHEARDAEVTGSGASSIDALLELVDRVLDYARAGLTSLTR